MADRSQDFPLFFMLFAFFEQLYITKQFCFSMPHTGSSCSFYHYYLKLYKDYRAGHQANHHSNKVTTYDAN